MKKALSIFMAIVLSMSMTATALAFEEADKDPPKSNYTPSGEDDEDELSDELQEMVDKINEYREAKGLRPLKTTTEIQEIAKTRAKELSKNYSHTRPNGKRSLDMLYDAGICVKGRAYVGENIAYGQKTGEEVLKKWMESEGHKKNIMRAQYTTIGVGEYTAADGTRYWVQMFCS